MKLRVALMRPIAEAARSALALRERGFEPVIVPVMEIAATGVQPPNHDFDAVLATSANAFAFLSDEARSHVGALPLYVAGERTAAAATDAGLQTASLIGEDASDLGERLHSHLRPAARLLYLTARDRKSDLEQSLAAAGHQVLIVETYVAHARSAWSAAEATAFSGCQAALHYSRRSAELGAALAERAGLAQHFRGLRHACISVDAAAPLRALGAEQIAVAAGVQERLLLDALESFSR